MDGFALELMDGDTGILCQKWTDDLFSTLQTKLTDIVGRTAKVFVLSVMGTQSTGKSTLLNIMFGCRMRVSAGQCTKGVYMQLIKSNFNKKFDYVLILDTEGLRAPEFFGADWSIWKDNRMATLAILSADATIITTVNEDDIAIREVVPIALLAHKRSKIAEENSGRQPTKLLFAYSRVDTTNLSKFLENRQSLHKTLHDAEIEMGDYGLQDCSSFLDSFNTSDKENESDIKYFGLLNKGGKPPDDTPNHEFGTKIAAFRKYIDEQTKCTKGQSLESWSKHIQLVYDCLETTNFELSYKSAMEHKAFNEFEEKLDEIKQVVAGNFCEAFAKAEEAIIKTDSEDTSVKNLKYFINMMDCHVQSTVAENRKKVDKILEENKYESFKEPRKRNFDRFVQELHADKKDKIKMTFDGRFDYEAKKKEYQNNISYELQSEINRDNTIKDDAKRQDELFEEIFERNIEECQGNYPRVNVRNQVEEIYASHPNTVQEDRRQSWHENIKQLGGNLLISGIEAVFEFVMGRKWSNESRDGAKIIKLQSRMDEVMNNVQSFEAGVVHKIISVTNATTKSMNAENAAKWNLYVKEAIIRKLGEVQRNWESEHNVRAKLMAEKEVLKENFKNVICKEIFGKERAIHQISQGLKFALEGGFLEYLSGKVRISVQDKGWVTDSIILEAHVDLKYLELSKSGRVKELISKLNYPKNFYEETVLEKISEFVKTNKDIEWTNLVERVLLALENSCLEASRMDADGYRKMQDMMKNDLPIEVLKNLPDLTTWDDELNKDLNKTGEAFNSNFIEIEKSIKDHLEGMNVPNLQIINYSKRVYKILSENFNPGARPRCTFVCPRCLLPCSKSLGHYSEDSRHNCDHQPRGLVGVHWKESNKLVGFSCAESVARGDSIVFKDGDKLYADFDKIYPEWMLPCEVNKKSRVRKYLFQEHNKAIADYYGSNESDSDNLEPRIISSIDELIYETLKKTKK
ncbi:interferon-induced very large GTPase 1-like [Bolinopsis microptera]|uniref:interferon-induced very large GTPase 1-like n=1 Tax=Bolinopsis microptera TaxID=2820187 RepID=UPI00307A47DD